MKSIWENAKSIWEFDVLILKMYITEQDLSSGHKYLW